MLAVTVALGMVDRTLYVGRYDSADPSVVEPLELAEQSVAAKLAETIRFPTISGTTGVASQFLEMHRWMKQTWPEFRSLAQQEYVGSLSLLYSWPGSDPNQKPVLFLAHQDVVPIEPGTEGDWRHPTFKGVVASCETGN